MTSLSMLLEVHGIMLEYCTEHLLLWLQTLET
jgi:hypothetical protein